MHRQRECLECEASDSPQWRKGPAGSQTLCNACGLRYYRKNKNIKIKKNSYAATNENKKSAKVTSTTDEASPSPSHNVSPPFSHSLNLNTLDIQNAIEKPNQSRFKFTIQKLNPILSFSIPSGTTPNFSSGLQHPTINLPYSFFNVETSSILTGTKPLSPSREEPSESADSDGNSISLPISIGKLLNS